MKVQYKLLGAFLSIIVVMIIGSIVSIQISKRSLRNSIIHDQILQARQIADDLDREMYYRIEEMLGYSGDSLLQDTLHRSNQAMAAMADRDNWITQQDRQWVSTPPDTLSPFMISLLDNRLSRELQDKKRFYTQDWLKNPIYPEIFITNRFGVIIAASDRTSDYFQADEDWYRQTLQHPKFWLDGMKFDESAQTYSCSIVVKILDKNKDYAGMIKAVLNIETVQNMLQQEVKQHVAQYGTAHNVSTLLLTRDYRSIFSSDSRYAINENIATSELAEKISRGKDEDFIKIEDSTSGSSEIFSYARSRGYRDYKGQNWFVILQHDPDEIFAPVTTFVLNMWKIAAAVTLLAFFFTHYFSRSFAGLVTKLGTATKQLQETVAEQRQTEEALHKRTNELNERVKELDCLYGILKLVEQKNDSVADVLQGTVTLIPHSWKYPDITCARIQMHEQTYVSGNFKETKWALAQDITVADNKVGTVEVFYLEKKPTLDEGPFLRHERHLLNAIAEQLGFVLERLEARKEKKQLEALLYQQDKLASVGQLAAGVAHEINNPIGFVSTNLDTLRKYFTRLMEFHNAVTGDLPPRELQELRRRLKIDLIVDDTQDLIIESQNGIDRVKEIVRNLKSFSRTDEPKEQHADINECLEQTIKVIWNELKYKARVIKHFEKLPPVKCYPQQLNQVFTNLLINAVHAIEKEGEITISTRENGGKIYVSIADTGQGIPPENINKLFEPFFTTKDVGKGTGLGLSISHDIIKKHSGRIQVESEVDKGTTFTVILPVS